MLYLSISNGYGENEAKFKQFINLAIGIQQFLAPSLKLFYNFEIILKLKITKKSTIRRTIPLAYFSWSLKKLKSIRSVSSIENFYLSSKQVKCSTSFIFLALHS